MYKTKGISLIVTKDYKAMSMKAAAIVSAQITLNPNSVIGLATGSTPEGMYKELVRMYRVNMIDFSKVTTFNLDEYYQLDPLNNQSYMYYMNKHLFKHVNLRNENTHIPNGMSIDIDKVCHKYDQKMIDSGGIDLQVLGIGTNGHIGFNEPDVHFEAGTHLVELDPNTINANARFFNSFDEVPKKAISMGIRNIMHARKIVLLANGENKQNIVHDMLFGRITSKLPASILQLHNDVTMILDEDAAAKILEKIDK